MAEYKVAFRSDKKTEGAHALTWEPGCPLEIEAIQVSRDTGTGTAFLQGKLRNISNQVALSFKATVTVEYEDGNTEDVEYNPLDADIAVGASYLLDAKKLNRGNVMNVSGKVESVKLADGAWMSSVEPKTVPKPSPIGLSDEAVAERYAEVWVSGKNPAFSVHEAKAAAANHLEKHEGWWLCPCGQVNVGRDKCVTCGASLEALENPDAEDDEALAKAAKERAEKEAKDRAEKQAASKKRNRMFLKAGIALAVVTVVIVILLNLVVFPAMRQGDYEQAMKDFDSKNYAAAVQEFDSLGDYKDSFAMKERSSFMESIKDWLDKTSKAEFFYAPYNENKPDGYWRSLKCEITLNSDGHFKVTIPQNDGNEWEVEHGNASVYIGDWEGKWSPFDHKLVLESFPGEQDWNVELTTYSLRDTRGISKSQSGPIIRAKSTNQGFRFNVFD